MKKIDITALGEVLIDMTCYGKSNTGRTLFEQNPGGAPANVLTAVKRLGGQAAFIGKVGNDMHGKFLLNVLENEGIITDGVMIDERYFTTLSFVNVDENGERSFSFARKPGADTQLEEGEVKNEIIKNSKIFHIGSLSLTDEPAKSATFSALEVAKNNCIISYDPNYRASLWKNETDAIREMRSVLEYVDLIKISDEETKLLTGIENELEASKALVNMGVKLVIVTMNKKGAIIRTKDGCVHSPALDVDVIDTTGAGDAFMGGFLYMVSQNYCKNLDYPLDKVKFFADFANKVSGFCVQRRGAIDSMPYINQI